MCFVAAMLAEIVVLDYKIVMLDFDVNAANITALRDAVRLFRHGFTARLARSEASN